MTHQSYERILFQEEVFRPRKGPACFMHDSNERLFILYDLKLFSLVKHLLDRFTMLGYFDSHYN